MDTQDKATDILALAEKGLRDLASRAVIDGRYQESGQIIEWAQTIGTLIEEIENSGRLKQSTSLPLDALNNPSTGAPEPDTQSKSPRRQAATNPSVKGKRGKKGTRRKYPKFFRDRDILIKVGWSKRTKAEYRHKAPLQCMEAMAETLLKTGTGGQRFSMEDVLPQLASSDGEEMPSYQAYIVLAWMRSADLVTQHGRDGYSISDEDGFQNRMESEWSKLPALK